METLSETTYKEIKNFAVKQMAKLKNASHNDIHIIRVEKNALQIVKLLHVQDIDLNLLGVICFLHDFTYTVRKPGFSTYFFEGHIVRKVISPILEKYNLSSRVKDIIINAVFHHAHSFPFKRLNRENDIYSKILQDADTLDYFDCLRVKLYMEKVTKGPFRYFKRSLGNMYLRYGVKNIGSFLNYPSLAKSVLANQLGTCLVD